MIQCKRIYLPPETHDGQRILVERLWPRGIKKEHAAIDFWLKEIAPSDELRRWFAHQPARWTEFQSRYRAELEARPDAVRRLIELAHNDEVTLVYAARDEPGNSAMVLRDFLLRRLGADT